MILAIFKYTRSKIIASFNNLNEANIIIRILFDFFPRDQIYLQRPDPVSLKPP